MYNKCVKENMFRATVLELALADFRKPGQFPGWTLNRVLLMYKSHHIELTPLHVLIRSSLVQWWDRLQACSITVYRGRQWNMPLYLYRRFQLVTHACASLISRDHRMLLVRTPGAKSDQNRTVCLSFERCAYLSICGSTALSTLAGFSVSWSFIQ
jgi:hypothetical protein